MTQDEIIEMAVQAGIAKVVAERDCEALRMAADLLAQPDYTITQTGVGIGQRAEEVYEAAKERGWEGLSDHCLMQNAQGDIERITLVQTGVGIGKPEQGGLKNKCAMPEACPEHSHEFYAQFKEPEQEPVATLDDLEQEIYENTREFVSLNVMEWLLNRLNTTTPQRKPLTDEEIESINVRLAGSRDLARLFARAIEAVHNIKV